MVHKNHETEDGHHAVGHHEIGHHERLRRRTHIVYARKMRERQIFMEELKDMRDERDKCLIETLKEKIGPKWYQVLSDMQRKALDTVDAAIHKDILERRPVRTQHILKQLSIYPLPNVSDLMTCVYLGRNDSKEMLAQLFLINYGHSIDGRRTSYNLNARLILSSILYLGFDQLIAMLRERFRPEPQKEKGVSKHKPKPESPPESPYLQKMIAVLYEPPKPKPYQVPPLPNLDELNEPYEDDTVTIRKPPPLPPPPPPPKKKLPISYCQKLAGIMPIQPETSHTDVVKKKFSRISHKKFKLSQFGITEGKKTYGLNLPKPKKGKRKKPVPPSTGIENAQYLILGVYNVRGRKGFILGSVSIMPLQGDIIHGGYRSTNGINVNIHCGIRGIPPPHKPDPCNCLKKWKDTVFEYIKVNKCYCGHYYDYGNEGHFPPEEIPFFVKPTRNSGYCFNYHTIYDLDSKHNFIEKEFRKIWDTDSMLQTDEVKQDKKKKKPKKSSTTCLGPKPTPEDYLKCALRPMKRLNLAAQLPDVQQVPELKEWMRRRIYGPRSPTERATAIRGSIRYWQTLEMLQQKGFGHVCPPKNPDFEGHSDWIHKFSLTKKFRKFTDEYKIQLYRAQAKFNNLMWPTMYQDQYPDKKFREIFFSYMYSKIEDVYLHHPYSTAEALERHFRLKRKAYRCLPKGVERRES